MEELFEKIHLDKTNTKNIKKNPKKAQVLAEVIREAGVADTGCDHTTGALLHHLAMKLPLKAAPHRSHLAQLIGDGSLDAVPKVDAAMSYAAEVGDDGALEPDALEERCGVGVEVSAEEVKEAVSRVVEDMKTELVEERYSLLGRVMAEVRNGARMQWADGKLVKKEVDDALQTLLGPRDERDKKKKKKKEKKPNKKKENKPEEETGTYSLKKLIGRDVIDAHNTREQLDEHKKVTGGQLITRFPPEPNGYLHIGHVKSINLNFGLAEETGGKCILRYDDTNPVTEETEFIDSIRENVEWLGFKPASITYSSDYFDQLYDLAVELIRRGRAYVCHQTAEEMSRYREEKKDSPWRNRSVEENLREFERMRKGLYAEGEATLRMKGDMQHDNPNMRDHVAYRIKYHPHPRTGDRYCIYPTYDYTHCLVDSLEHVDYSLCTLEFEIRRESYFWLLNQLDLYKPNVWEFSRLNVTNAMLSKRKLNALVQDGTVRGYDDPRLFTIAGLRRRGYPPAALNAFAREVGITRSHNVIDVRLMEHHCRKELDRTAPRRMVVRRPLRVVITNYDADKMGSVAHALDMPFQKERSTVREVPTSRVIYIEETDFRMQDEKGYRGLAPGKAVGLKYLSINIVCDEVVRDNNNERGDQIRELKVRADYDGRHSDAVQQHVHWVPETAPEAELRFYDLMFLHENPSALKDQWRTAINPNSEVVVRGARMEPSLKDAAVETRFQFERVGFFVKDQDSRSNDMPVFNLIVSLRESKQVAKLK